MAAAPVASDRTLGCPAGHDVAVLISDGSSIILLAFSFGGNFDSSFCS